MTAQECIAESRGYEQGATPAPWKTWGMNVMADPVGDSNLDTAVLVAVTSYTDENNRPRTFDADFICHARTALPRANDALEAVLKLHRPVEVEPSDTICGECSFLLPNGRYFGKIVEWPCPTVRVLDAMGGTK